MQERLFFLHIYKTAGISVHHLLDRAIAPYAHLQHAHELAWPAALVWSRFRGCGGHLTYLMAQRNGYTDGFAVTFLRDPVDRVLSQVDFMRRPDFADRVDAALAHKLPIQELLQQHPGQPGSLWNAQTYALSSCDHLATPEQHLRSALANLERFDFIGLTESFATDAGELVRSLGGADLPIPHENRSVRRSFRDNLDPATLALLVESQSHDRIVYNRAVELRRQRRLSPRKLVFSPASKLSSWPPKTSCSGTGLAEITRVTVRAPDGHPNLQPGDNAEIAIHWTADQPISDLTIGLRIEDPVGNYITGTNSLLVTGRSLECQAGTNLSTFQFTVHMGPGRYLLAVALHQNARRLCWLDAAVVFEIVPKYAPYREGMVDIDATFHTASRSAYEPLSEEKARLVEFSCRELPSGPMAAPLRIPVRLSNPTDAVLSSEAPSQMFAAYHWIDAHGKVAIYDGDRTPLPETVWPQGTIDFDAFVAPPPHSGDWSLQLRLVEETVRWHEGPGFEHASPPDLRFKVYHDGTISYIPTASRRFELSNPLRPAAREA